MGYFTFSGQQFDVSVLNQILSSKCYNSLNAKHLSYGGGRFMIRKFFLGGEGEGFIASRSINTNNTINFNAGYGCINLGYVIFSSKRSVFYTVIGGYSIDLKSKSINSNFQDQLNSPNGEVSLSSGGLLLNSQLCYQYFFAGRGKEGFIIGLKAGYSYSPLS